MKFYAALGNHDVREERDYKPFNMNGRLYYSFKAPNQDVRFFVLESSDMIPDEVKWIDNELRASTEEWKIVCFHDTGVFLQRAHTVPIWRCGQTLEPMFIKYGVSVVLSGHDHVYERTKPQHGITYFVVGSGGELRRGDLRRTSLTAVGFDADNAFLIAEIIDDSMYFNAISRTGKDRRFGNHHGAARRPDAVRDGVIARDIERRDHRAGVTIARYRVAGRRSPSSAALSNHHHCRGKRYQASALHRWLAGSHVS